ncbi:hypothetical protein TUMEXPCC7403_25500 [Tumidithrix helvetica PCC 7403]|uniref:hypothetical protein n=1 Tax=Tumidithrix helvetica TaxID=3457545 RepID=UPI003C9B1DF3
MRIKTASVTYSRKFNLGNYEAAEISVSLWSEIDPEESEEGVIEALFALCKEQVKKHIPPSYKRTNSNHTVAFTKFGKAISTDENLAFDPLDLNEEERP